MNTADEDRMAEQRRRTLDELVPDPDGMPPLCEEKEFGEVLETIVAESAPRLFAVVQEYGIRVGVRVAGWGLAHEDHVDVIGMESDVHLGAHRPEDVLRDFGVRDRITARIVWLAPVAPTPDASSDAAECT